MRLVVQLWVRQDEDRLNSQTPAMEWETAYLDSESVYTMAVKVSGLLRSLPWAAAEIVSQGFGKWPASR